MIFLVNLWSSSSEKVLLAMKCFGLLYEESCLLTSDRPSPIHPFPLASAYHKFGNDVLQTGNLIQIIGIVFFNPLAANV